MAISVTKIIWFLIIGGIAGWLSGIIKEGKSFGFLGNIVVGILGAIIGAFIFDLLGIKITGGTAFNVFGAKITGGEIGQLFTALIGAILLLFFINLIKKK